MLQLAIRDALTHRSLPTTWLLSPRTHADNSTPLFATHADDSNVSPSKLRHFTMFAPTRQAEKSSGFGKGRRSLRLPVVVAKRFDPFFFFWFFHFSHFGLWNIFDSGVWITWKTKKEKHYQGQVTVWALKPMKKFDSFNYCNLSTIANNRF